jgi:acetyltransferase-like isoleucine patch superfamily enzyme
MQRLMVYMVKGAKRIHRAILQPLDWVVTYLVFYCNGIKFSSFTAHGVPFVNVGLGGKCRFGKCFRTNNREASNPIGRFHRCSIAVLEKGNLIIGDHVGLSSAAIVCHERIEIGDYVQIGGNTVIYDTDFHSLDPKDRLHRPTDFLNAKTKPVRIGDHAFIGSHSTILKGVTIGRNAVIGACSVVTKDIPENEVWAGNPARFIKKLAT